MKKIIAILFISVIALSCNDDDTIPNGVKNPYTGSVVGLWQTVGLAVDGEVQDLSCEVEVPIEENFLFEFNEDGTFNLYHNCDIEVLYNSGTYTTTGNVLTLNMDGMTGKAHMIDNLDEDQLGFRFTISSDGLFHDYDFLVQEYEPIIID